MAQLRLGQRYGLKDFRSIPAAMIKGEVPGDLRRNLRDGRIKLGGLQDLYTLLAALGDALGAEFKKSGLAARDQGNPLSARNRSILAHGLKPLHQRDEVPKPS